MITIPRLSLLLVFFCVAVAAYFGSRSACSAGKLGEVKSERLHEQAPRPYIEEAKKALRK